MFLRISFLEILCCLLLPHLVRTEDGLLPLSRSRRDLPSPECRQDQLIASLISKVDALQYKIEDAKFLDRAFMVANLGERLTNIAQKMDSMQTKMATMETLFMRPGSAAPSSSSSENSPTQTSGLENKLELYGKKIVEQQNTIRSEARDLMTVARSFKSTLEDGMNKIFGKLNSITTKAPGTDDNEVLDAVDSVKEEVEKCTASSSTTKTRLDDIFTDLLSEWSASHKQMREIDIKLNEIKERAPAGGVPDEVELVAAKVRKGFERLEDLEPKVVHAVRVSTDLENAADSDDKKESIKMLSGNLSSTLKGLQDSLEDSLKSTREGIAIMDEFVINPQDAKGRLLTIMAENKAGDYMSDLNRNVDRKLQAIADQIRTFLSTEGLASLNALKNEMQQGSTLFKREHESQNVWRAALQQGMTRVQEAIDNAAEELRKCTAPKSSDELRSQIARKLRNSMGFR